jgi:hypothetical protein
MMYNKSTIRECNRRYLLDALVEAHIENDEVMVMEIIVLLYAIYMGTDLINSHSFLCIIYMSNDLV